MNNELDQLFNKFALPVVVLVSAQDKKALPIILTMAAILGTLIGIAGHYLK